MSGTSDRVLSGKPCSIIEADASTLAREVRELEKERDGLRVIGRKLASDWDEAQVRIKQLEALLMSAGCFVCEYAMKNPLRPHDLLYPPDPGGVHKLYDEMRETLPAFAAIYPPMDNKTRTYGLDDKGMPPAADARVYPCNKCGKPRSKEEGGTTFTVCEKCWDENYSCDVHAQERDDMEDALNLRPDLTKEELEALDEMLRDSCPDSFHDQREDAADLESAYHKIQHVLFEMKKQTKRESHKEKTSEHVTPDEHNKGTRTACLEEVMPGVSYCSLERGHTGTLHVYQGSKVTAWRASKPHEVSEPSTHEEVMESDNRVIKEAFLKSQKCGFAEDLDGHAALCRRRAGHPGYHIYSVNAAYREDEQLTRTELICALTRAAEQVGGPAKAAVLALREALR